jgi:predicted benzoate:H+ symporter BenE
MRAEPAAEPAPPAPVVAPTPAAPVKSPRFWVDVLGGKDRRVRPVDDRMTLDGSNALADAGLDAAFAQCSPLLGFKVGLAKRFQNDWDLGAAVGVALPLFIVTMASQNVPGVAITASFGYEVPWRETMTVTGLGTLAGAPFGGHAINLAAITAALAAGPSAGEDRSRRWIACVSASCTYLVLAVGSGALAALVAAGPGDVVQAAAGLALLGTLGAALAGALADEDGREAAVVCFLVAASGITVLGVGAAFWALLAGLVLRPVLAPR